MEWWQYRYKKGIVFGIAAGVIVALSAVSIVQTGDPVFASFGAMAAAVAVICFGYAAWKYRKGPQPDETPVREIDLTDEDAERIATQIAAGIKERNDD